jgi:rhodanese-related sulfurtransferase
MEMTKLVFITLLLMTLSLSSCSSSDNANINQVTPKESAGLTANDFAVIIDVRTVAEWKSQHIFGATLIPLDELKDRISELEQYQGQQLIMQCAVGGRSSKAVEILQAAGFTNVSNMNGGIVAWEKAGLPLE